MRFDATTKFVNEGEIVDPCGNSRATEGLPDHVRGFDRRTEKQRRDASDLGTLLLDRSGTRESRRSPHELQGLRIASLADTSPEQSDVGTLR
jgi:hypothetical protein